MIEPVESVPVFLAGEIAVILKSYGIVVSFSNNGF